MSPRSKRLYDRVKLIVTMVGMVAGLLFIVLHMNSGRPRHVRISVSEVRLAVDGLERRFRLAEPHGDSLEPRPVLIAFHGTGDNAAQLAHASRLDQLATRYGFVVVYPEAIRGWWNTLSLDDRGSTPDLRTVDAIHAWLQTYRSVDRHRLYVAGLSNGGDFAFLAAGTAPDRYAGVIVHSAGLPSVWRDHCVPPQLPRVLWIAGVDDSQYPIATCRDGVARLQAAGHDIELLGIERLGHRWAAARDVDAKIALFLNATRPR